MWICDGSLFCSFTWDKLVEKVGTANGQRLWRILWAPVDYPDQLVSGPKTNIQNNNIRITTRPVQHTSQTSCWLDYALYSVECSSKMPIKYANVLCKVYIRHYLFGRHYVLWTDISEKRFFLPIKWYNPRSQVCCYRRARCKQIVVLRVLVIYQINHSIISLFVIHFYFY